MLKACSLSAHPRAVGERHSRAFAMTPARESAGVTAHSSSNGPKPARQDSRTRRPSRDRVVVAVGGRVLVAAPVQGLVGVGQFDEAAIVGLPLCVA